MMRQSWREELDSHVLDCADELVQLGYDRPAALAEAETKFGDRAQIEHDLQAVHPWLAVYADWIVVGVLTVSIIPLSIIQYTVGTSPLGIMAEQLTIWWWAVCLLAFTGLLIMWQLDVYKEANRRWLYSAFSLAFLVAATTTAVLDVNNFETILYNILYSLVVIGIWSAVWEKISTNWKRWFIVITASAPILFAWREEGLFERWLFPHCAYLIPSTSTSPCLQISVWSVPLLLIYTCCAVAAVFVIIYLINLWQSNSKLHRKLITTGVTLLLPLLPLVVSGVNRSGSLDVVSWKQDIYQAYVDILGRRPEDKDYDFYGATRSYQHMSRVREVLYQSEERRIKVNLLFQEYLQRDATTEELDHYADSTFTIEEITAELQRSH